MTKLRSIPPITSTGKSRGINIRSSWGLGRNAHGKQLIHSRPSDSYDSCDYRTEAFKKPPLARSRYAKVSDTKGAIFDIFEEGDMLKVIGGLPSFITKEDLDVQIKGNTLHVTAKQNSKKDYEVTTELPAGFDLAKRIEIRNNIMIITMEKEISGLEKIFQRCLEKFPELKNEHLKLKVERTPEKLEGAIGTVDKERIVMLWVPDKLWGHWEAIKPIIYHELSHCINLRNPDKVFFERADEKSIKLWKMLQEAGVAKCEVVDGRK